MRVLGYITAVAIAIIIVGGVVVLLMSIGDIKRYLAIRKM